MVGLLLRVGMVAAAATIAPHLIAEAYAVSGAVFYLAYLLVVGRMVAGSATGMLAGLRKGCGPILAWVAAGGIVILAFHIARGAISF